MGRKKKRQRDAVEREGPDATIKHPLHVSPALSNFSSCQLIVELNSTKNEKSKRKKTTHNAIEGNVNGCGTPENIFSPKASTPALDMPSEHPIQCFATDPIMSHSCEEVVICQGHNEEKEQQNMINSTAENSNAQQGVPEVRCNHISVAASPEPFAKESVSEVVKLNIEHGINGNISNPEDKNGFVKNTSLVKKNVDDPAADYDLSDENLCVNSNCRRNSGYPSHENCNKEPTIQDYHKGDSHNNLCVKTYARRKMVNSNCRRNSGYPSLENCNKEPTIQDHHKDYSRKNLWFKTHARRKMVNSNSRRNSGYQSPENCNKEPTIQDHHKDDSHKFFDGPLRVGLMDGEAKLSIDQVTSQSVAAAEEIKLSADNINEQRFVTTSSPVDIPVEQLETNGRQLDNTNITRNYLCCAGDVSDLSLDTVRDGHLKISQFSLDRSVASNPKNKLLILDMNGLLADFVSDTRTRYRREPEPDFVLKGRKVYKRPFCDDFLQFCFDRFHVGVWSSRTKSNIDEAIKFLMGKSASKLLFCWNQSHCTTTKFTTVENICKPLMLKELRKLWEKAEPDLPWEKGEFNESNTILLDDSPDKALLNPMHSAIFPYTYRYYDTRDSELGPGGDLRVYLEGLAMAENVQKYVLENPFGQLPIREANPSWGYYCRVIEAIQRSQDAGPSSPR